MLFHSISTNKWCASLFLSILNVKELLSYTHFLYISKRFGLVEICGLHNNVHNPSAVLQHDHKTTGLPVSST